MTTTINGYKVTLERHKNDTICEVSMNSYKGSLSWVLNTHSIVNPRGKKSPISSDIISLIFQWAKQNGY